MPSYPRLAAIDVHDNITMISNEPTHAAHHFARHFRDGRNLAHVSQQPPSSKDIERLRLGVCNNSARTFFILIRVAT